VRQQERNNSEDCSRWLVSAQRPPEARSEEQVSVPVSVRLHSVFSFQGAFSPNRGFFRKLLDSARYMKEAQALYHSVGFKDIEPFAESEIPQEFHIHWVFMEITL
jgi:hypothetical protein